MSITFTNRLNKPSELTALPNRFLRPAFGELYGFDAEDIVSLPSESLLTEASDRVLTESGEYLILQESGQVWFFIEQNYNTLTNTWSSYS